MNKTIWKDIPNYEGLYQASIFGYIRSLDRTLNKGKKHVPTLVKGKIISPWIDVSGYLKVDLYKDGKRYCEKVHKLIAKTFIPNPERKETVNHKDENPLNNTVKNLEWMTNLENVNYGTRVQRVKENQGLHIVRIAPDSSKKYYFTLREAERQTGIARQSISYSIKNKTLLKGFKWEVVGDVSTSNLSD